MLCWSARFFLVWTRQTLNANTSIASLKERVPYPMDRITDTSHEEGEQSSFADATTFP